ncbi:pyrroline-5-carboxylate reductase dimerization domain-containing protein, partial [Ameyamaea chiangmaiensis]
GMTVACAPGLADAQRALCTRLLEAVGEAAWVENEEEVDAVTAVSGSGPGYVFLVAELLEKGAVEQGLSPELARILARQTVAGAGALLARDPQDAADLRRQVTSPGGTTQAALDVLMAPDALPDAFSRAIAAARARAAELAS